MILEPKKIIPLLGIEHGMTILDIGSGVGFWIKPLIDIVGPSGNIIAVDNQSNVIQRLNNDMKEMGIKNVHGITGNLNYLSDFPIKQNTCHRIILVRMLDYLTNNLEETFEQVTGFLKNRGQLIVIDSITHRKQILNLFQEHSHLTFEEIPLIAERSDYYFFGVRIIQNI